MKRTFANQPLKISLLGLLVLLVSQFLHLAPVQAAGEVEPAKDKNIAARAINGAIKINGTRFAEANGRFFFMMGVNYVGSTDRAWKMWDDDQFDANLINRDFDLAEQAGLNTVRIFVMPALRDAINANRWDKLDKVFELAGNNNLRVLLTFNDYAEPNLSREADLNKKIAARYANNNILLGYDLKNEPQFGDIATSDFPAGLDVPFLKDDFIKAQGERRSQDEVNQWRTTTEGKNVIPARFDARRAYLYANAYFMYLDFLSDAGKWVNANSGKTTLDYIDTPEAAKWKPFIDALSGTTGKWIEVRQNALKSVDGDAIVTIGWSNAVLAKMAANRDLSFVSLHRFVAPGYSGLIATTKLLENLRSTFGSKPLVLEEFGYSNSQSNGELYSQNLTANYETALWLYLYGRGYAGGAKWMLVNFPPGFNKVENNYGLLDDNTQPKVAYRALQAVTKYIESENHQPGGTLADLQAQGTDLRYAYRGQNALLVNNKDASLGSNIAFTQEAASPFAAWWNDSGDIELWATTRTQVALNLNILFPRHIKGRAVTLVVNGNTSSVTPTFSTGLPFDNAYMVRFTMEPNTAYKLKVPIENPAFKRANPLGGNSLYFQETGHNLSNGFRTYWEQHGGLAVNGFPLSEEFQEVNVIDGKTYTVQYFERSRFEYHPENAGTPYTVLLGHFGRMVTKGREGEAAFKAIPAFPSTATRRFFPETNHSLGGSFKSSWEQNGGLFQFGYPITEEFQEVNPADGKTYTVQYFERARFEYHPENKGTKYEVLLGLLGWQIARSNGYIP